MPPQYMRNYPFNAVGIPVLLFLEALPRLSGIRFKAVSYLAFRTFIGPLPPPALSLTEIAEAIGEAGSETLLALDYLANHTPLVEARGGACYALRVRDPKPEPEPEWLAALQARDDERCARRKRPVQDPERVNDERQARGQNNRAAKAGVLGTISGEEWRALKERFGYCCVSCGRSARKNVLYIDHVVALSEGGHNIIANVQPLCKVCSSLKGARHIDWRPLRAKGSV